MSAPGTTVPSSRYIAFVCGARLPILLAWFGLVACSGAFYLSAFRIDNSIATWFLESDPELAAYVPLHEAFGESDWLYLWLETENPRSANFLDDLESLEDRLRKLDAVTEVQSLASIPGGSSSPLAENFVPSGESDHTIVAIRHRDDLRTETPYRIRLIDEIREQAAGSPLVESAGIVGTGVINAELNRAARRDMVVYYSLITAFVLVAGGLALGHWRDLLVLASVVIGTIIPVMGAIAVTGLPFNLITIMLPTLLVTVSVSYLVHFLGEFHRQRDNAPSSGIPVTAISSTFARLLRPGAWTTLTTAIGFASLTLSPVAPVQQLGGFAALGIAIAWLNTITIAPALLSLLWTLPPPSGRRTSRPQGLSPLVTWLARPHPGIATVLALLLLAGTSGLHRLVADTDYLEFFRPGNRVREDYATMERLGVPSDSLRIILDLTETNETSESLRHGAQLEFERDLVSIPGIRDIDSLDRVVDLLASNQELPEASPVPLGGNPEPRALLRQRLAANSDYLSADRRKLQLRAMTSHLGTRDIQELRRKIEALPLPESAATLRVTGTNVLWANMDSHVIHTQLRSIGFTALFLLLLLPLAFRSFVLGIVGFAVSFVPVLSTLGLMAWLGLPINIATCLLGGVVIGLAVDDTIYFLARFREGAATGLPASKAASRAVETTGRAMIKTSLILVGGFLTMGASDFLPSVYFGLFFSFSLLVALLADLLILPVLLRLLPTPRVTA